MKRELRKYNENLRLRAAEVFDLVIDHEQTPESTWGTIKGVRLGGQQLVRDNALTERVCRHRGGYSLLTGCYMYWNIPVR